MKHVNPILHRLFLHPILHGEGDRIFSPYVTFSGGLVEQKCLVGCVCLILKFFIINWSDELMKSCF